MIIFFGFVVIAAAVALGVGVALNNSTTAQLTLLDHAVPGVTSTWQVFMAGAVLAIVFMGGVIVTSMGIGRAVRVRRELRDLRDEHEESLTHLELEKQHLQRELARARREHGAPAPGVPVAPAHQQAQPQAPITGPGQRPGAPASRMSSSPFFDSAG